MLVDGSVQIAPLPTDANVGLVDAHRPAMRLAKGAQPAFDQGSVGQDPAVEGAVVDLKAALQEHLLDVTIAEWVAS